MKERKKKCTSVYNGNSTTKTIGIKARIEINYDSYYSITVPNTLAILTIYFKRH